MQRTLRHTALFYLYVLDQNRTHTTHEDIPDRAYKTEFSLPYNPQIKQPVYNPLPLVLQRINRKRPHEFNTLTTGASCLVSTIIVDVHL